MATGTAPPNSAGSQPAPHPYADLVEEHVRRTQGYLRGYDIVRAVITLVVFVLGYLMALAVVDNWLWRGGLGRGGRTLAWVALVGCAGAYFWRAIWPHLFRRINPVYAADRLEHAQPSLMNSLVNFLLLRDDERPVAAAVMHGLERQAAAGIAHLPAEAAVDRRPLLRTAYALVGLLLLAALFVVFSPKSPLTAAARILFPWADIAPATRVRIDTVEPGSHDVFRGEPVTVTAKIRGLSEDDAVTLRFASADGQTDNQSVAMVRPEGESVYRGLLPPDTAGMQRDLVYRVEAGDAKSRDFALHVVPAPTIQIENIEYRYPGYTRMEPLVVPRQGDIKALEGTQVIIRAKTSQPIGTASLVLSGGRDTTLGMQARALAARGELLLKLVRRDGGLAPEYEGYKLVVTNERGESNPQPPTYRIEVIPDLPPQVDIYEPRQREVKLPVDGELSIDARARDADFALSDVRLTATRNGKRLLDESLVKGQNLRLDQPVRPSYRFAPARLGLQPGDEVLFRVTAIDNKLPRPNRQQTPEYRIEIVGPSGDQLAQNNPREETRDQSEQRNQGATGTNGQEGTKGEQGAAGQKRENQGGERAEGEKSAKGEKSEKGENGEKGEKGEKGSEAKDGMNPGEKSPAEPGQGGKHQEGSKSEPGQKGPAGQEPDDAAPKDPVDDGQAVQEIVKHLEQQGKKLQDQPGQQDGSNDQKKDQIASAQEKQEKQERDQQKQQPGGKTSDSKQGENSGQQNQPQSGQKQQPDSKQGSSQNQSGGNQQGEQNSGDQKDGQKQQDQKHKGLKPQPNPQQGGSQQSGGGASSQQEGKQEGTPSNSSQGGGSENQQGSPQGNSQTANGQSGSKQDGSQQGGSQPSGSEQNGSNPPGSAEKSGNKPGQPGDHQESKSGGADAGGKKQPGQGADNANAQKQPGQSQGERPSSAAGEQQKGGGSQQAQKKDTPAAGTQPASPHDQQRDAEQQGGEKSPAARKQDAGAKAERTQKSGDQVAANDARQNQSSKNQPSQKSDGAKPGHDKSADQKTGEKSDGAKPPGLEPGERDPQTRPEKQPEANSGGKPQSGGPQGREQKDGNSSEGSQPQDDAKNLTQKSGESSDNRGSGKSNDKPQDQTRAPGKTPGKGEQAPSESQTSDADSKNPERQRASDTSSSQSGERAGKGPEGMGQQSSGAGGGSAGKNQAADDGGNRSQQSGPGDQGNQAGNQQPTNKKTGQAGTQRGDARQGRPEHSRQASADQRQGDQSKPSEPNRDAQQGQHPGEGKPTEGQSAQPSSGSGGDPGQGRSGPSNTKPTGEVVAGSDEANLNYARKATDLTLAYLQDQLAKGKVDDALRQRLGWSDEEFQALLKRMQAMRERGADPQARPEDKLAYEQWLKSLGLHPSRGALRTGRPETKALDRARDDAQTNVPRDLREQHEAFRRGLLEKVP